MTRSMPTRSSRRVAGALSMLLAAAAALCWAYPAAPKHADFDPDLMLDPAAAPGKCVIDSKPIHDFGATEQEQPGSHTFQVRNDGTGPLFIELADKSCGCTAVAINGRPVTPRPMLDTSDSHSLQPSSNLSPESLLAQLKPRDAEEHAPPLDLPLPSTELPALPYLSNQAIRVAPGETASVQLSWNTGQAGGSFEQWVRLATSDPDQPSVELRIRGQVVPTLWASENPVRIGAARAGQSASAQFQLFAKDSSNLQITSIHCSSPLVTVQFRPAAPDALVQAGARSGLDATLLLQPGLPIGTIQEQIVLTTNLPDRPELVVPVTGQVAGEISFAPVDHFDFELIVDSRPQTKNLVAQIHTESPIHVAVARVVPEYLACSIDVRPRVNQSRQIAVIKLTVPVDAPAGPLDGFVEFETDHPRAPRVRLPIRGFKLPTIETPEVAAR